MRSIIFIVPKDISVFEKCSIVTARLKYNLIKDTLGKKKHQKLTVNEYCNYMGITREDLGITE